jgi:hypothetical protein
MRAVCFLPRRSSSRLRANLRPLGALRFGVRSLPNIRRRVILNQQCTARVMFLRRSGVIFVKTLCTRFQNRCSSPAQSANGFAQFDLNVSYLTRFGR